MPIRIDPDTLQQVIRPGVELRKDSECRVDINSDTIQFRSMSESHEAYLDYSIPRSAFTPSEDLGTGNYWTTLDYMQDFVQLVTSNEVTIIAPTEADSSKITLQSDTVTYQYPPLASNAAHPVYRDNSTHLSSAPVLEVTLLNGVFTRALNAAALVGESMRIQATSDTRNVEFSASSTTGDSFLFSTPVDQVIAAEQPTASLTIAIDRLRDIVAAIPSATPVSLQLMNDYLVYRAEFPVPDAEIAVYIAEYLDSIYR